MPAAALDRQMVKVVAGARQLQAGQPSDKPPRKPREPYVEAVRAVVQLVRQVEPEGQVPSQMRWPSVALGAVMSGCALTGLWMTGS